jgi:hypothetical protein
MRINIGEINMRYEAPRVGWGEGDPPFSSLVKEAHKPILEALSWAQRPENPMDPKRDG